MIETDFTRKIEELISQKEFEEACHNWKYRLSPDTRFSPRRYSYYQHYNQESPLYLIHDRKTGRYIVRWNGGNPEKYPPRAETLTHFVSHIKKTAEEYREREKKNREKIQEFVES